MLGKRTSVTTFVVLVLAATAAVLVSGDIFFDVGSEKTRREGDMASRLDVVADQLTASLALPAWNFDRPQIDKIADAAMQSRDIERVTITLRDASAPGGRTIIGRARDWRWESVPSSEDTAAGPGSEFEERNIVADGETVGSLRLTASTRFIEADMRAYLTRVTLLAIAVGAALAATLYLLLWYNVLRPLAQIERETSAMSAGQPLAPGRRFLGELERLRGAIGKMVGLLETRYAAVQQHEGMLSSVLNAVPQSIFWKDRNSVYVGANEWFARSAGLRNAEEVVGKTDFDLTWKALAVQFQRTDREVMNEGKTKDHFISEIEIAGGEKIWVHATKTPLREQDGEVYGVLGVYEDITERKAAEEALQRQAAFNDMANRILAGLVSQTGAELDQHLRNSLRDIARFMGTQYAFIMQINEELETAVYTHVWKGEGVENVPGEGETFQLGGFRKWGEELLLRGEAVVVRDVRSLPAEAGELVAFWTARGFQSSLHIPLRGAGGGVRGTIGQFCKDCPPTWTDEDIERVQILTKAIANTLERRQAEEALRQSEARFRSLIEFSPISIVISQDGTILYGNQAFLRLFGFANNAVIAGQSLVQLVAPEKKEDLLTRIRRRSAGRPISNSYETIGKRMDGAKFPFHVDITTVTLPEGEADVAFIHDLTERRRADALAIESEKLRTVAGLASGVAHEINNPLAGMVQNAQVVLSRLTQETPANREAAARHGTTFGAVRGYIQERDIPGMIETIRASGRQASRIVQNLLAYSRRDAPPASVNLAELMDRTLDLAANDYDLMKRNMWAGVEIVREYDAAAPAVRCVAAQMQQVLLNLIRNAVHAMQNNPAERPKRLILRTMGEEGFARMEVEDTGPGVPAEIRSKIFEPFFTTKAEGEGTGLGLFVSFYLVEEMHGGRVWVEEGEGWVGRGLWCG